MRITIRPAGTADAPALAELAADTFPLACPPDAEPAAIAAFIAENFTLGRFEHLLASPAHRVFVAEDVDGLQGYTLLVLGDPADTDVAAAVHRRPTIELSKFYTRRSVHGGGVSAPLMESTLSAADALGAASVWLGVNDQNARAIRFYEKSGFLRVGSKRFRLGDRWESDHVLERVRPAG